MAPSLPTSDELTALAALWNQSEILRHHGMRIAFQPHQVVVELPEVRPSTWAGSEPRR